MERFHVLKTVLDPNIKRWYGNQAMNNEAITMLVSPSMHIPYIHDSDPRTYASNNLDFNPGYVFEATKIINFKSLVMMKRFDGMRDRYQGMITKK